jgi:hypothetical protein
MRLRWRSTGLQLDVMVSPWFSTLCRASIRVRTHVVPLIQQISVVRGGGGEEASCVHSSPSPLIRLARCGNLLELQKLPEAVFVLLGRENLKEVRQEIEAGGCENGEGRKEVLEIEVFDFQGNVSLWFPVVA